MLRISKLTDYAVVVATQLAMADDAQSVRELGDTTGIPQPTVSKVLKALAKAGVVHATRGARGGYALAKGGRDTNVAEVITAIEGPIAVTECTDESTDACVHEPSCGVRTNWQRINLAVQSALEAISLDEMAASSQPPLVQLARSRAEASARRVRTSEKPPTAELVSLPAEQRSASDSERRLVGGASRPEGLAPHQADESVSPA